MSALALPRAAAPETLGISSDALRAFVEAASANLDSLHSFMLVKGGQVAAEGWWKPYAPERRHLLYSLSKSFASTAAGLAISEGRFTLDDPVAGFFPDEIPPDADPRLAALSVRDLLQPMRIMIHQPWVTQLSPEKVRELASSNTLRARKQRR